MRGSSQFFGGSILIATIMMIACCLPSIIHAQILKITGSVTDSTGKALPYVNVNLKKGDLVVSFGQTTTQGTFLLEIPDSIKNLQGFSLGLTHIGFKKQLIALTNGQANYEIKLSREEIILDEIKIRKRPIVVKTGDTLSYNVNSFSSANDRSIGDVLKRMPGIAVDQEGKISYNGQTISNLFIGGDDLMSGRYDLATRAISKDLIQNVEVLKHHQPIKVLKDKITTNDVAINLTLKDERSLMLSGESSIGIGLPSQLDAMANVIALNKNLKMLNSLKVNNIGTDFRRDFKDQRPEGNALTDFQKPNPLLSAATIGKPDLPKSSYYDNKSAVLNLNDLHNTTSGLQMKFNLQGFADRNSFAYTGKVINFLPSDTILYQEHQDLIQKSRLLNTQFSVQKNTTSSYLSDHLSLNLSRDKQGSTLNLNGSNFGQQLSTNQYEISNDFSLIPSIKSKHILSLKAKASFFNNPQDLTIMDRQLSVLNLGSSQYNRVIQSVKIPTLYTSMSAAYIVPTTRIRQNYQLGVVNEFKQLNSSLNATYEARAFVVPSSVNKTNWNDTRLFFNPSYNWKSDRWHLISNNLIQYRNIDYGEDTDSLTSRFSQLTFNPTLNLNYKSGKEDYLSLIFSYRNAIGDISSIYRENILLSYRSISRNAAELQERSSMNASLSYHLEKSIQMLFGNISLNFNRANSSTILYTSITNDVEQTVMLPISNGINRGAVNLNMSKYIFPLKGKVDFNIVLSRTSTNLYFNDELFPFVSHQSNIDFKYITNVIDQLNVEYGLSYTMVKSSRKTNTGEQSSFATRRTDQSIKLIYTTLNGVYLESSGQLLLSQYQLNNGNSFFNISQELKYRFTKPKLDLGLSALNLLNTKNYTLISDYSNQLTESTFKLRSTMLLLKMSYLF